MTSSNIKDTIESYMKGNVSEELRMSFEKWLTDGDRCQAKNEALSEIWENLSLTSDSGSEDPFSIIENAEKLQEVNNLTTARRKTVMLWVTSVVAACMTVFAIVGWYRPVHRESCLMASTSSKGEFLLPDGTKVWLNKDSRLRYSDDLSGANREVILEGEGYFDVTEDKERPFIVYAGEMSITVLGTRFTVSAYEDGIIEAYLEEGSIVAEVPKHAPLTLSPDQAVRYDSCEDSFFSYMEPALEHTAWIDGKLEFVNKSLKDIFECLEHWYCVDISCNDMNAASQIRLSMTIRQESIAEICSAISAITDLSYFIDSAGNVKISFDK